MKHLTYKNAFLALAIFIITYAVFATKGRSVGTTYKDMSDSISSLKANVDTLRANGDKAIAAHKADSIKIYKLYDDMILVNQQKSTYFHENYLLRIELNKRKISLPKF